MSAKTDSSIYNIFIKYHLFEWHYFSIIHFKRRELQLKRGIAELIFNTNIIFITYLSLIASSDIAARVYNEQVSPSLGGLKRLVVELQNASSQESVGLCKIDFLLNFWHNGFWEILLQDPLFSMQRGNIYKNVNEVMSPSKTKFTSNIELYLISTTCSNG